MDIVAAERGELDENISENLSENGRSVLVFEGGKHEIQAHIPWGAHDSDACSVHPFIRNAYL